ncbi:hypothetical protein Raf01_89690 [Rugosimonospora africana]|uniref:Uncharacterized protein n=2 Tax=Rugosimonospora africana TaxID=556532 RepID=A0A8J3R2Q8_9ACTN|nr:hypothetical protein Raf01_89690 [Rugosimonospora africana]
MRSDPGARGGVPSPDDRDPVCVDRAEQAQGPQRFFKWLMVDEEAIDHSLMRRLRQPTKRGRHLLVQLVIGTDRLARRNGSANVSVAGWTSRLTDSVPSSIGKALMSGAGNGCGAQSPRWQGRERVMGYRLVRLGTAMGIGIGLALAIAGPASADPYVSSDYHAGDVCTVGDNCAGSASFIHYGDHLYLWDNDADGHSVVVKYMRSDTGNQQNTAWNEHGAFTRSDHNMDIPESGWIKYQVCLGEFGGKDILDDTCSPWGTVEYAS